jgi:ADP-heptose:LPS heptosyltransferase
MRALFLIPGDGVTQLQTLPAVAATANQLGFQIQVACAPELAPIWKLLPAVEKVIPFNFAAASMADWANLLGSVREPDFQLCINLAGGLPVNLMLAMSHIPNRIASAGFAATDTVTVAGGGWPAQTLAAYLRPVGVNLDAAAFRLKLPAAALAEATAELPAGDGPLLLLAPAGGQNDWPEANWQALPERIRQRLSSVRVLPLPPATSPAGIKRRAALVAAADVVLASDPISCELALLCGVPVVAIGRDGASLPQRDGVKGLMLVPGSGDPSSDTVLAALGLA